MAVKERKRANGLVYWLREGRRLSRLLDPAEVTDPEVMMLDVYATQQRLMNSAMIVQESRTGPSRCWKSAQTGLLSLPNETLEIIADSLSVVDVENLAQVSRWEGRDTSAVMYDTSFHFLLHLAHIVLIKGFYSSHCR
jgi:hypothetical protein